MTNTTTQVETLADLAEASDEALLAVSVDGRILVWNRGAEAMFGYAAEQALGQTLAELIMPPEHAPEHRHDARRAAPLRSLGRLEAGTTRIQVMARC